MAATTKTKTTKAKVKKLTVTPATETTTKTVSVKKVATDPNVTNTNANNYPSLPSTLEALQFLRTNKNASDKQIHGVLDKAFTECKKNDIVLLLERVMLHMGDISRQHNLLKELGILSKTGGAQERAIFRSCMRWWEKNLPESFEKNLRVFVEFTLYENLMYYQNTTDRKTGKVLSTEILFPMADKVHNFLIEQIRKGKDLNLIAKHLPKFQSGKLRVSKKVIKAFKTKDKFTLDKIKLPKGLAWIKVNGVAVEKDAEVKAGDVLTYPRKKQEVTLEKQAFINKWILEFCKAIDWDLNQYKAFRTQQNTAEQKFSSKSILSMPKSDFMVFLDRLTAGQRFRVAKMVAYKDKSEKLVAKEKWGKLGSYYIEWEGKQEEVANQLRQAALTGDENKKKELMKDFKVKATGMQTLDLLADLLKGSLTNQQVDNTYQALIEKMDLIANVFPILDGSGSMDSHDVVVKGVSLSRRQIVYSLAIAFSTRNPVAEFRNTFGWFSTNFHICGHSKFKDERPNPYVNRAAFTKEVPSYQILSETKTFTENLKAIHAADPKEVASTNMFSSVEHFVKLVNQGKCHTEDLPQALLFLTDNENNTGKSPKEAVQLANTIGWRPLLIFWGIIALPSGMKEHLKNIPNVLLVGGFNESCLSQVLRGIKSGSINPETELWAIFEDKRYSVLN